MGSSESYIINKDSIFYSVFVTALDNELYESKSVIKKTEWDDLINSISIEKFTKIKGSGSNAPVDGTDTKISISTSSKEYSFINGYDDKSNYKNISVFIKELDSIRTKYRQ